MLENAGATYSIYTCWCCMDVRRSRCHSRCWSHDGNTWFQEIRHVSRHRRGCHKLNHGCTSGRGAGRGRNLVISLRAGVGDGRVVTMVSGGSHRHPSKKHDVSWYVSPRGASHNMGVACNISPGCRPLGSQQKGQKTNTCEPKHLSPLLARIAPAGHL